MSASAAAAAAAAAASATVPVVGVAELASSASSSAASSSSSSSSAAAAVPSPATSTRWTSAESRRLSRLVEEYSTSNPPRTPWRQLANQFFANRSWKSLYNHYRWLQQQTKRSGPLSPVERAIVHCFMATGARGHWSFIAQQLPEKRSGQQVRHAIRREEKRMAKMNGGDEASSRNKKRSRASTGEEERYEYQDLSWDVAANDSALDDAMLKVRKLVVSPPEDWSVDVWNVVARVMHEQNVDVAAAVAEAVQMRTDLAALGDKDDALFDGAHSPLQLWRRTGLLCMARYKSREHLDDRRWASGQAWSAEEEQLLLDADPKDYATLFPKRTPKGCYHKLRRMRLERGDMHVRKRHKHEHKDEDDGHQAHGHHGGNGVHARMGREDGEGSSIDMQSAAAAAAAAAAAVADRMPQEHIPHGHEHIPHGQHRHNPQHS